MHHQENLGLGAAIRTGVRANGHDLIAMLDADGTYAPSDLPRLIAELERGYDVVIGSPYHPAGRAEGVGPVRQWLSRSLSRAYRNLSRSDVCCFSGIFKVYRREVLDAVEFDNDGFAAVSEILLGALARGFRVAEVPATLTQRATGRSKMNFWPELRAHISCAGTQ